MERLKYWTIGLLRAVSQLYETLRARGHYEFVETGLGRQRNIHIEPTKQGWGVRGVLILAGRVLGALLTFGGLGVVGVGIWAGWPVVEAVMMGLTIIIAGHHMSYWEDTLDRAMATIILVWLFIRRKNVDEWLMSPA